MSVSEDVTPWYITAQDGDPERSGHFEVVVVEGAQPIKQLYTRNDDGTGRWLCDHKPIKWRGLTQEAFIRAAALVTVTKKRVRIEVDGEQSSLPLPTRRVQLEV